MPSRLSFNGLILKRKDKKESLDVNFSSDKEHFRFRRLLQRNERVLGCLLIIRFNPSDTLCQLSAKPQVLRTDGHLHFKLIVQNIELYVSLIL